MEKIRRILVSQEVNQSLQQVFGCTKEMVSRALNYRRDTELAKRIRALALQKGGILIGSDGKQVKDGGSYWLLTYGERVAIIIDKSTGGVTLLRDNEELSHVEKACSLDLFRLQRQAELIAGTL